MATDREVQKQWTAELQKINGNFTKSGVIHLYPLSPDWAGTLVITNQSNYGTGSSIMIYIGACWLPHDKLFKELSPEIYFGKVTYATSLYDHVPDEVRDKVASWRVQSDPHGPFDFSLPVRAVQEYGFSLMERMCSVEFALQELGERVSGGKSAAPAWVNYVLALELTNRHEEALACLSDFVVRNEGRGKFIDHDFGLFAERFRQRFDG